jgi:hypothetical protein
MIEVDTGSTRAQSTRTTGAEDTLRQGAEQADDVSGVSLERQRGEDVSCGQAENSTLPTLTHTGEPLKGINPAGAVKNPASTYAFDLLNTVPSLSTSAPLPPQAAPVTSTSVDHPGDLDINTVYDPTYSSLLGVSDVGSSAPSNQPSCPAPATLLRRSTRKRKPHAPVLDTSSANPKPPSTSTRGSVSKIGQSSTSPPKKKTTTPRMSDAPSTRPQDSQAPLHPSSTDTGLNPYILIRPHPRVHPSPYSKSDISPSLPIELSGVDLTVPHPRDIAVRTLGIRDTFGNFEVTAEDLRRFRSGEFVGLEPEGKEGSGRSKTGRIEAKSQEEKEQELRIRKMYERMTMSEAAWRKWEELGGVPRGSGASCGECLVLVVLHVSISCEWA